LANHGPVNILAATIPVKIAHGSNRLTPTGVSAKCIPRPAGANDDRILSDVDNVIAAVAIDISKTVDSMHIIVGCLAVFENEVVWALSGSTSGKANDHACDQGRER
jgi:hypothetical protein